MAVAVPLRSDFDAAQLRALAKRAQDPDQTRRLLALAAIYDGASRTEAAQIGCVTLQIVRDWVLRFNARGPEGLRTGRAPGAPPRLTDQHRQALQAIVDRGPIPAIHGVVRWEPDHHAPTPNGDALRGWVAKLRDLYEGDTEEA